MKIEVGNIKLKKILEGPIDGQRVSSRRATQVLNRTVSTVDFPKKVAIRELKSKGQLFKREFERKTLIKVLRSNEVKLIMKRLQYDEGLKLDSRVLRVQQVQKFLSKLKQSKPVDRESILSEIDNFNLQTYLSEITNSIADMNITDADVLYFVKICSKLHQSYEDFQINLLIQIQKQIKSVQVCLSISGRETNSDSNVWMFEGNKMGFDIENKLNRIATKEKDEKVAASRRRDMLRFLTELFVVGFSLQIDKVFECLKLIIQQEDKRKQVQNLSTALMFADRFGFDILRVQNTKLLRVYEQYDDLPNIFDFDSIVPAEKIQKLLAFMQTYLNGLIDQLKQLYDIKVKSDERMSKLIEEANMTEKDEEAYTRTRNNYLSLQDAMQSLGDNLGLEFDAHFGHDEETAMQQRFLEEQRRKKVDEQERLKQDTENLFDSPEERAFYEDILDLKTKLPTPMFANNYFQGTAVNPNARSGNLDDDANAGAAGADQDDLIDDVEQDDELEEKREAANSANTGNILVGGFGAFYDRRDEEDDEKYSSEDIPKSYERFRRSLKHCVSTEKADSLACQFMHINNKQHRRKLVRDILEYRKEYNLMVPHLCRFVAVISRHFKDLGDMLVEKLIKDFELCLEKQRQDFSFRDKKMRYLKYMCELTKFRVLELPKVLAIFKSLVDDFNTQQVDLLCLIMDNIGRFIYSSTDTRFKYLTILETLNAHLRKANLPTNKSIQLENSITLSKPSKRKAVKPEKIRGEHEQYIRYLVLEILSVKTFKQVTTTFQEFQWTAELDTFCFSAIIKRALKGRIDDIQLCAGLLAFLNTVRPSLTVQVVDELIERTVSGMEENEVQTQQRRISVIRFLGELYLYQIVEIEFVLDLLYMIITYGHSSSSVSNNTSGANAQNVNVAPSSPRDEDEEGSGVAKSSTPKSMDGPDDLFRISMVCNLLEPVRQYLKKKRTYQKVLRFLLFFQRYILSKRYVPIDIEFLILDTFESLDSGSNRLTVIKTLAQSNALIQLIESKENSNTIKSIEDEVKAYLAKINAQNAAATTASATATTAGQDSSTPAISVLGHKLTRNLVDDEAEQKQRVMNKQFDDEFDRDLQQIIKDDNQIQSQMIVSKNLNFKKKIVNVTSKVNVQNEAGQTKTLTIIKKKKDPQAKDQANLNSFLYGQDGILNDQIQMKIPKVKKKQ